MTEFIIIYWIGVFVSLAIVGFKQAQTASLDIKDIGYSLIWFVIIPIGILCIPLMIGRAVFYTWNNLTTTKEV